MSSFIFVAVSLKLVKEEKALARGLFVGDTGYVLVLLVFWPC